jgi:hypothetical protein
MSQTSFTPRKIILTFFLLDGTKLRPLQMIRQFDDTDTVGPMCKSIEEEFFPSSRKGFVKVFKVDIHEYRLSYILHINSPVLITPVTLPGYTSSGRSSNRTLIS